MAAGRTATIGAVCGVFCITLLGMDTILSGGNPVRVIQRRVSMMGRALFGWEAQPAREISAGDIVIDSNISIWSPGIRNPVLEPAHSALLADEADVIGITVNGQSRAYLPKAMSTIETHVINDLVDDTAVTVTYCDRTDCVRVLTEADCNEPLNVFVAGFRAEKMTLEIDGQVFSQDADNVPLRDLEFTRTSWRQWKLDHPLSKVYVGNALERAAEDGD